MATILFQSIQLNKTIDDMANINVRIVKAEKEIEEIKVASETIREVTAYNVGDPNQTDSSPCTGAYSKVDLCEEVKKGTKVCAANFVPLGTKLQIVADNGWDFKCIVWDRMNSRFNNRVDVAMSVDEKTRAVKFGVQNLKVRILSENN